MQKRLPIGIENFEDMINEDYYYIDKTGLIKSIDCRKGLVNYLQDLEGSEIIKYEYVKVFL